MTLKGTVSYMGNGKSWIISISNLY